MSTLKEKIRDNIVNIVFVAIVSVTVALWDSVIRPNIVLAGDVLDIRQGILDNATQLKSLAILQKQIQIESVESRKDDLIEKIDDLEIKSEEIPLRPTEKMRLRDYKNRLDNLQKHLNQLNKYNEEQIKGY